METEDNVLPNEEEDEQDRERLRDKFKREREDDHPPSPSRRFGNSPTRKREKYDEFGRISRDSRDSYGYRKGAGRDSWEHDADRGRDRNRESYRPDRRREHERSVSISPERRRYEHGRESPPSKRRKRYEDERDEWDHYPDYRERDDRRRRPRSSWPPYEDEHRSRRPVNTADLYDGPLKTLKQYLDEGVSSSEAQKKYEVYVSEYNKRQAMTFFNEHKQDEWFIEKYEPNFLLKKREATLEAAKSNLEQFKKDFMAYFKIGTENNATVDPLLFNLNAEEHPEFQGKEVTTTEETSDLTEDPSTQDSSNNNANATSSGRQPSDSGAEMAASSSEGAAENSEQEKSKIISLKPSNRQNDRLDQPLDSATSENQATFESNIIFIKTISPSISREDLENLFKKPEGFQKLILSEAMRHKNFHRYGWVTYDTNQHAKEALEKLSGSKLKDFELQLALNKNPPPYKSAKIAPPVAATTERIEADLKQSKQLVELFDKEKSIESSSNPLNVPEHQQVLTSLNSTQSLDVFIVYLRNVHNFCYYCGDEFEDNDEMLRKCGKKHLRGKQTAESQTMDAAKDAWATSLDAKIKTRLEHPYNPDVYTGKDRTEKKLERFYKAHIFKLDEERYRCNVSACNKLFCGESFVKKHLGLKHPELLEAIKKKAIERQFFQNYFDDPKKTTPQQQPPPQPFVPQGRGGQHPRASRGSPYSYGPVMMDYRGGPPVPYGYPPYYSGPRGRGGPPSGGRGRKGPPRDRGYAPPPPPNVPQDPRALRDYVDLDNPVEETVQIDYKLPARKKESNASPDPQNHSMEQ